MSTAIRASTIVGNRVVYTWWPDSDDWYGGLLTGYGDAEGRFHLEHVVALKPHALIPMLRAGIAEAETLGYQAIVFSIPDDFPTAKGLSAAARRVGCTCYNQADGWSYWVRALQ